jgi:glycosyltransferase involved in cell wall biosynthesis
VSEKKKVLILSDHPLSPSGVGTQTRYFIEAMIKTGKYKFICLGGAIKHHDYSPIQVAEYGEDWIVIPIDGYGEPDMIRSILRTERPDVLWFMTDPRFFTWLWAMEDEIRPLVPMVYYHVWDNYPYPLYNKSWYDSTDRIACISKVTHDIVTTISPETKSYYLPHSVDTSIFKKFDDPEIKRLRAIHFPEVSNPDKLVCFWNNRNARRKQSGTLIYWFKEFLDKVGHENACLVMHTDPKDPHGQNLEEIIRVLNLDNGQVMISKDKIPPEAMAGLYNIADCTINISDAEGFGLATFESLACETPIIVTMTGGLQEQVTDGEEWFGVGLEPASKAVIGSQEIPYIYEDRVSKEDFLAGLTKIYDMSREERAEMGAKGRNHVVENYNFDNFAKKWQEIMDDVIENCGSWETRKNYDRWTIKEVS